MLILEHFFRQGARITETNSGKSIDLIVMNVQRKNKRVRVKIVKDNKELLDYIFMDEKKEIYDNVFVCIPKENFLGGTNVRLGYEAPKNFQILRYYYPQNGNPVPLCKKVIRE